MRGEHYNDLTKDQQTAGSSPHARGTPRDIFTVTVPMRFIPACAGNTIKLNTKKQAVAVHPRMRGEHFTRVSFLVNKTGSSPHARGTQQPAETSLSDDRFIPACAGNTPSVPLGHVQRPVHPRMRGEHGLVRHYKLNLIGSSQHARGTPVDLSHLQR